MEIIQVSISLFVILIAVSIVMEGLKAIADRICNTLEKIEREKHDRH